VVRCQTVRILSRRHRKPQAVMLRHQPPQPQSAVCRVRHAHAAKDTRYSDRWESTELCYKRCELGGDAGPGRWQVQHCADPSNARLLGWTSECGTQSAHMFVDQQPTSGRSCDHCRRKHARGINRGCGHIAQRSKKSNFLFLLEETSRCDGHLLAATTSTCATFDHLRALCACCRARKLEISGMLCVESR
jgi:hypothetical protein